MNALTVHPLIDMPSFGPFSPHGDIPAASADVGEADAVVIVPVSSPRRRATDFAARPASKRPRVALADPLATAFGLRARPDPSAIDADPEAPPVPGAAPADAFECPAVWRLHDIALNVDSLTYELRQRISGASLAANAPVLRRLVLSVTSRVPSFLRRNVASGLARPARPRAASALGWRTVPAVPRGR